MAADERDRSERLKAEEKVRYAQLPEISAEELEGWLWGELPEECFFDGKTHQASTWTCDRVFELAASNLGVKSLELDTRHILKANGVFGYDGERYASRVLSADQSFNKFRVEHFGALRHMDVGSGSHGAFLRLRRTIAKIESAPVVVPRPMDRPPKIIGPGCWVYFVFVVLFLIAVTVVGFVALP